MKKVSINGKLWKYQGPSAWYFLSSGKEQTKEIRKHQRNTAGWKSVPVRVTIGESTWNTSFFPTKEGPYLLPVKASVRKREGLDEGTRVRVVCVFI